MKGRNQLKGERCAFTGAQKQLVQYIALSRIYYTYKLQITQAEYAFFNFTMTPHFRTHSNKAKTSQNAIFPITQFCGNKWRSLIYNLHNPSHANDLKS